VSSVYMIRLFFSGRSYEIVVVTGVRGLWVLGLACRQALKLGMRRDETRWADRKKEERRWRMRIYILDLGLRSVGRY
jgi:hypothetical protein